MGEVEQSQSPGSCWLCECVNLRHVKVIITRERKMIRRWNLHESISLGKSQKSLETHGCKPWATKLSTVCHTLGILTTNIIAMWRRACRTSHVIITWHFAIQTAVEPLIHLTLISFSIWLQAWQITRTVYLGNYLPWNVLTLPEAMATGATCVLKYLHVTVTSSLTWVDYSWNFLLQYIKESQVNMCVV